jgi:uncharacterized protein
MLRRSGTRKRRYRLFFATDIHGSDRCFRKFLAAAKVYEADALILGGDIAGKAVVPIIENGGSRYTYQFQGVKGEVSRRDLEPLEERIKFNGLYPYPCDHDENERIRFDGSYRASLFERLITDQLVEWRSLAEERLSDKVRCIITPGNDDPFVIDEVLEQPGRIECPEGDTIRLGPVWLASLGNTNRTPWNTDREYDEEELAAQVDHMLAHHSGGEPCIFNFHCPPYASTLDTVVKLDEDLRPVLYRGMPVEIPVGSKAIRTAIETYSPVVGLHGHIHEAQGVQRIGRTVCINPGSEYGSGILKGAIVDIDSSGEYIGHLLTSG